MAQHLPNGKADIVGDETNLLVKMCFNIADLFALLRTEAKNSLDSIFADWFSYNCGLEEFQYFLCDLKSIQKSLVLL